MTDHAAKPPPGISHVHALLEKHGYMTRRCSDELHNYKTTLGDLVGQNRLFTNGVNHMQTVGCTHNHLVTNTIDIRRPKIRATITYDTGDFDVVFNHIGYMYDFVVYSTNKEKDRMLIRNERSQKLVFVDLPGLKKNNKITVDYLNDIILNVTERGNAPPEIYDLPDYFRDHSHELVDIGNICVFDEYIGTDIPSNTVLNILHHPDNPDANYIVADDISLTINIRMDEDDHFTVGENE
jgi:hypothetical protein